ncbi:MAG TPA: ABC transporter substrate-binding protein [Acidimicrobiia bacterium]|nr:ABC transporter substrate-binding protein [Acidimicrobiia bacterium]
MKNRWKSLRALLLVLAVVAVACGGDAATDTTTGDTEPADTTGATETTGASADTTAPEEEPTTTIAEEPVELVAVHGSSPDFIALVPAAGWDSCAERGINVTQEYVEDGSIAIQAIAQGEGQIATNIGVNVGLLAVDEGASIVDVMATQRPTWALVSRNEISSIEELAGLTMGVHGETSFTKAIADFYDEQYELGMEQVIIPGSEVRAEALANDQIDASVIDLPDVVSLGATYPDSFTVLDTVGENLPDLIEQDIWMNRTWVEENPELAQEVTTCLLEGLRNLVDDPDYALEVATELLPDQDPAILEELIAEYIERDIWDPNGALTEETAQYTVEFFADLGEIDVDPATVDLEKYFNFDLLENAVEELGRR